MHRFSGRAMAGFSLLEVAMVLLITGALLGAMLQPFGAQMVEQQRSETMLKMLQIQDAVLGYAMANSRLPCPLQNSSQPQGNCGATQGMVPAAVLGVDGNFDENGFLVDAWGVPIRYNVTLSDADADGIADFTLVHGMQTVGMQTLQPDLEVCDTALACAQLRANQLPVVIISTGANAAPRSDDERENTDGDNRFVKRDLDEAGADQFDDLLLWVSENSLYTHMIQARVLP
jgi:type II secretory pathway pseudopilin PulG